MASTDGDSITLDEALAFIDFCDNGAHDESAAVAKTHEPITLEDIDELLDDAVKNPETLFATKTPSPKHQGDPSELQAPSPPRKKRVRNAASSSTVLQRRKKAELLTLREEATALEAFVAQHRRAGCQPSTLALTKDDGQLSPWHRHALLQYRQRRQSEQINRQLKEVLDKQLKISHKLQSVLHKRNVLDGLDFVRTLESPCFADSRLELDHYSRLMNQLEGEVEGVYRDFNRVFRPQQESMILCTSQTTYDEKCQTNTMQFVTTTPLNWPMRAAFKNVWSYLETSSDRSSKPNTLETKANVTLPIRDSPCHFHKLHFLRKFEEKDRIVIIWSDIMQMTSRNVRFRSLAHAVFTRSETDPLNASVMHTNLKLYMESPSSSESLSPEDARYGKEVVLGGFGRLMRKYWQGEQNRMLDITSHPVAV